MPYGSKLHIAPTSYHLLDAQRKQLIEKYSRRFFGRKRSKAPMRTSSSQHYGHLRLAKENTSFSSFLFFAPFLVQTPHPSAHPTPPHSDKKVVVALQKKERSGRGRKP